jgi:hypothetical protein
MEEQGKYEVQVMERYDMTSEAMSPTTVMRQVRLIQEVMREAMREGEHYGVIPGCGKKPSLLKPGAEKLSLTFRLSPSYEVIEKDLSKGHREYRVKCTLTHIPTGQIFGEGVGACSTMEGKYRFRTGEVEPTGKPVPQDYWKDRDIKLIGGKGFGTKKIDGKWEIVRQGEKVEHDNPADYYNTVLKMAKKRAHVDATLTATAASDIFTQDIEDMDRGQIEGNGHDAPPPQKEEKDIPEPYTEGQRKKIYAILKIDKKLSDPEVKDFQSWVVAFYETTEVNGKKVPTKTAASQLIESIDEALVTWREEKAVQ